MRHDGGLYSDSALHTKRSSSHRLPLLVAVTSLLLLVLSYLSYAPARHLYHGAYSKIKPTVSETFTRFADQMPFGVTPSNDNGVGVGDGVGGGYGTDDTDSSVEQGAEKGLEDGPGSSEHVLRKEEETEEEEEQEEEEKTDEERENSDGEYNVSEGPLDDYDYDDIVAEEDQAEAGVDQKTQTLDGASDEGLSDGGDTNTEQQAPGDSSGKASDGRKDDDAGAHEDSNQESVPPMEGQHARDRDSSRSGSGERHDDVAGEIKGQATEMKKEKEDSQSSKGTLSEFSLSDLTEESHAHEDEEEEQKGVEKWKDEAELGSDTEQGTSATDEEEEKEEESTEGDTTTATDGTATKATNEETNDGESSLSERYRLTKELAASVASLSGQTSGTSGGKGVVVVTWANFHYKDFVMNWVRHLNATGCKAFLVGAMDDQLLKVLVDRDVPTFSMSSGLTLGDFGWGSQTFNKMGREKVQLIQTFTKWGQDVLISDVDTVWMRNPLEYVAKYPEADILTSSDHLAATATDGGLEHWPQASSAANIGIMLFRAPAAKLADEWVAVLDEDPMVWDQNAFNDLFLRGAEPLPERRDRLFLGYDKTLKIGILPVSMFASGHTFFTQRMPERFDLDPYVAHATFQFSGTPGKRNRFRERLLWDDPSDYFEHPGGFVVVDNDIPAAMLKAAEKYQPTGTLNATLPHFNMVNLQLRVLRALFGISTALNRVAVLPSLWCGQDRWWAPHSGIIPGSDTKLPFLCPADHVLDLEVMSERLPPNEFGPDIPWREYSFLDNPKAAALRESVLIVRNCGGTDADTGDAGSVCADGSFPGEIRDHTLSVAAGLTDKQLIEVFSSDAAKHYKVLRFADAAKAWGGFAEPEQQVKFKRRIERYGSIWCCVDAHPGHVWYDMFWDQVPHEDRHGKRWKTLWEPTTGP